MTVYMNLGRLTFKPISFLSALLTGQARNYVCFVISRCANVRRNEWFWFFWPSSWPWLRLGSSWASTSPSFLRLLWLKFNLKNIFVFHDIDFPEIFACIPPQGFFSRYWWYFWFHIFFINPRNDGPDAGRSESKYICVFFLISLLLGVRTNIIVDYGTEVRVSCCWNQLFSANGALSFSIVDIVGEAGPTKTMVARLCYHRINHDLLAEGACDLILQRTHKLFSI